MEIFKCAQREVLVVGRQVQRLPDRCGPRGDLYTGSIWLAYNPFTWVDVAHQHRDCLTYKCESLQRLLDWCARKKWVIGSQRTDAWT